MRTDSSFFPVLPGESASFAPRSNNPTFHPTLRLVNKDVVLRRQTLRLVIDEPEARAPVDGRAESARGRMCSGHDPIAGIRRCSRLVGATLAPVPRGVTPTGEVRKEMHAASGLSTDDARAILVRRTTELLEGGRAARLAPVKRQGLERLATKMGLRAFDAHLVIAIAQDAARSGARLGSADVEGRLGLVGCAREAVRPIAWSLMVACGLALVGVAAAVRWVGG